jgi:putative transposase
MRQSKFTETQIVSILKEADAGRPVNEFWRQHGISSATYYKWKAKCGCKLPRQVTSPRKTTAI